MNNTTNQNGGLVFLVVALALLVGFLGGHGSTTTLTPTGSVQDQVFLDATADLPTTGIVTAGPQASTQIVATNTARLYLEITNEATTSPGQPLYCNTNDRPAVIGQGIVIFASSTRTFKDLLGSIRCLYGTASSGVAFLQK